MPGYFGKHGFKRPAAVQKEIKAINVGELDERLEELLRLGAAKQEGEKLIIDVGKLGFDEVLGGGRVTHPLEVIAKKFVGSAKRKLEQAGGAAVSR